MFGLFKKFKDVPGNLTEQMANTRLRFGAASLAPHVSALKNSVNETIETLLPISKGPATEALAFDTRLKELSDLTHSAAKLSQALQEKTKEATLELRCTIGDIDRGLWNLKGALASADQTNFRNPTDEMERILSYVESLVVSVDQLQSSALKKNERLVYAGPRWFPPLFYLGVAGLGGLLLTASMIGLVPMIGGLFGALWTFHDIATCA